MVTGAWGLGSGQTEGTARGLVRGVVREHGLGVLHGVERRQRQRLPGLVPGEPEAVGVPPLVQHEAGERLQPPGQDDALALGQEQGVTTDPALAQQLGDGALLAGARPTSAG
jgi:hypothetical protein